VQGVLLRSPEESDTESDRDREKHREGKLNRPREPSPSHRRTEYVFRRNSRSLVRRGWTAGEGSATHEEHTNSCMGSSKLEKWRHEEDEDEDESVGDGENEDDAMYCTVRAAAGQLQADALKMAQELHSMNQRQQLLKNMGHTGHSTGDVAFKEKNEYMQDDFMEDSALFLPNGIRPRPDGRAGSGGQGSGRNRVNRSQDAPEALTLAMHKLHRLHVENTALKKEVGTGSLEECCLSRKISLCGIIQSNAL
jgi:hypothetical protein